MNTIGFVCNKETFKPVAYDMVRWLDQDKDFQLFRDMNMNPSVEPITREEWDDAHKQGYHFCAIIKDNRIVACAAVWKYSESSWEVAAVGTKKEFRCRGYAKAVCSFVTSYILNNGRQATCHTEENNIPMIKVLESLNFKKI